MNQPVKVRSWRPLLRFAPLAALALVAVAAVASGVLRQLTPAGVAEHRAAWEAVVAAHPVATLMIYVGAYAALTGAGLPVAMVMTFAGALLFGVVEAGFATATAATLAAVVSYAAARWALADLFERWLTRRPRAARLVEALRGRGFWYLLSGRLMPMMPFPAVNVAAGVARAPFRDYLAATVVGALISSFLYASLGAGIGETLASGRPFAALGSPMVWGPLAGVALLSLLPAVLRRAR